MNVFIDTNVILSFYHLTGDDLEELNKLVVLAKGDAIHLYLPSQVRDEIKRNRENKIADALKRFNEQKLPTQFPAICKQYEEYKELRKLIKLFDEKRNGLLEKLRDDMSDHKLKADTIIDELLESADIILVNQEIVEKARLRMDLGNPPGKKGSLGDAINWAAILHATPAEEDIYFISDDSDYFSPLKKTSFNEFLHEEWRQVKQSELHFYKRLSGFLKDKYPDIKLASEVEKELLITELSISPNFATTHSAIQQLSKYSEFTDSQLNSIVRAAISNNQVYWIIDDEDIHEFFTTLIKGREDRIEDDILHTLEALLEGQTLENIEPAPLVEYGTDEDEDDLPF